MKEIEKEMEYTDALVTNGIKDGDMPSLEKAHRTLANLGVTVEGAGQPAMRAAIELAIAYFYVKMAQPVFLLQISSTTNPTNFRIDPIHECEYFFHKALRTAREAHAPSVLADTYFFIGIGYDSLRASLVGFKGIKLSELHDKAVAHVRKAVSMGTSFSGSSFVLQKILSLLPEGRDAAVTEARFRELHAMLYLNASLPKTVPEVEVTTPPLQTHGQKDQAEQLTVPEESVSKEAAEGGKTDEGVEQPHEGMTDETLPPLTQAVHPESTETVKIDVPPANLQTLERKETAQKGENIYIDYKWRFSVARVDASWEFYPEEISRNQARLIVKRGEGMPKAGTGVQIAARVLSASEMRLSIEELVKKSLQVLIAAGYKVETEGKINFKGYPAYEAVLTHTSSAIGSAAAPFSSKQYMLVILSSEIQYILSFNTIATEYDKVFPDLKEIVNSFIVF
ncbi:MAG: hypothetical protein AB1546_12430 [bacterium]